MKRPFALALALVLATACGNELTMRPAPPPPAPAHRADRELSVDGNRFVDRLGRTVILRGFNLAGTSKTPPFAPLDRQEALDRLPALGANVIRLVFIWEAYEPTRGRYDEAYLARLDAVAAAAWRRGLFVIIDVHQDLFSRFNADGCGDGFPRWALPDSVVAHAPDNGPDCRYWSTTLLSSPDIGRSFAAFYANRNQLRARYLTLLGRLARHFAGRPGIIGFDLLNEPVGDEATEIAPLYADAIAAIRREDSDAILFVEPSAVLLNLAVAQSRIPILTSNVVYSPHFYDWAVVLSNQWTGSRLEIRRSFALIRAYADGWHVPVFVGEYGAPADAARAGDYIDAVADAMDALGASGAQWAFTPGWSPIAKDGWNREDYSVVDDRGQPRANLRLHPYPQRVAGRLLGFAVARDRALGVRWIDDGRGVDSELFAPRQIYGDQPRLDASAGLACRYDNAGDILRCKSAAAGEASLMLRPRPPK
jgi:endoglycosylceramidase